MKISNSVSQQYEKYREKAEQIQKDVAPLLRSYCAKGNYLFLDRIKEKESFALKLEANREIDDMYAATIVVPSLNLINSVVEQITSFSQIDFLEKRPKNKTTSSAPNSFEFDSVRLYFNKKMSVRDEALIEKKPNCKFEVQVKTLLDYAWGLVSHDIDYKSDSFSWAKSRVCAQVKAILDNAELTLAEIENLSNSSLLELEHKDTKRKQEILNFLSEIFDKQEMPLDAKRLTNNVINLFKTLGLDNHKEGILIIQKYLEENKVMLSLSPYFNIVRIFIMHFGESFFETIDKKYSGRSEKFQIIKELEINSIISNFDVKQYRKITYV